MSKRLIVKVQTPLNAGAVPIALIYDQTREIMAQAPRVLVPQWNEIVQAGGKAFYLARFSNGEITLIRRVEDRPW